MDRPGPAGQPCPAASPPAARGDVFGGVTPGDRQRFGGNRGFFPRARSAHSSKMRKTTKGEPKVSFTVMEVVAPCVATPESSGVHVW